MERERIIEGTPAGLNITRQLRRKDDRNPNMAESKIESAKRLLASGVPAKNVTKNLGMSVSTLYR